MKKSPERKAPPAPPPAPAVKAPDYSLAVVAREIARIQKKLGVSTDWYKG